MRELIRNSEHMYKLYEDGERLVIAVVCGGIAMYEVKVVLTEAERQQYADEDEPFLIDLACRIARNHEEFADRIVT